jgi:fructosamine-3-kinase
MGLIHATNLAALISFAWMEKPIVKGIEQAIETAIGQARIIRRISPVGGGCIHQAFKAETSQGSYFIKLNESSGSSGMFDAEAHGLMVLRKANAIALPAVIATGDTGGASFLVLEWIEPGKRVKHFFEDFGQRLAQLHGNTQTFFGLEKDNYIGSLKQINQPHESFTDFFIEKRLEVQLKMAIDHNKLPLGIHKHFERLYSNLPKIIPPESPALLHGDLWNGNYMTGPDGRACIFDPAVYYGHREADLAMTLLFGGFNQEFYESYHGHFPLEKDWRKRTDIFNLYPLLVHVNLFGGGYAGEVTRIVQRF